MLSLINLSVNGRKKTITSNLHAVFAAGYVHGLFAPRADLLNLLLESISGQNTRYTGSILYNDLPLSAWDVSYTDCRCIDTAPETLVAQPRLVPQQTPHRKTPPAPPRFSRFRPLTAASLRPPAGAAIDFSKKILLLHHLHSPLPEIAGEALPARLHRHAAEGNTILISSQDYQALRDTCDYIYLYDKKRFPIVVEKADFARFDTYFENVFGRRRSY